MRATISVQVKQMANAAGRRCPHSQDAAYMARHCLQVCRTKSSSRENRGESNKGRIVTD